MLSSARVVSTYHVFSQTSDEGIHIAASYDIVRNHNWRTDIHHPPLARFFIGLGILRAPQPTSSSRDARGNELLFSNDRYLHNLALARAGNLLFLVLGIFFVARWAMRLFSPAVGVIAAALFAMLPAVLAHAGLATTDMAVTAMLPFALDETSHLLEAPSWRRGVMTGIAVALGMLSKYSFFVFYPACAVVLLLVYRRFNARLFLCVAIAIVIAVVVVWLGFGCSFDPLIAGIQDVRKHNHDGHRNFLFEQLNWAGWWYYFPVALFFKTPIPFLILAIAGCVCFFLRRPTARFLARARNQNVGQLGMTLQPAAELPLIALAIVCVAMTSRINIGVRHVLPIYAPLSIVAAALIVALPRWRVASAMLVAWLFVDGVFAHPDYLPWFNGFAREPAHILNDSNLDWGQDVIRLVRYTRAHHIEPVSLLLFSSADLDRIGFGAHKVIKEVEPIHGWFAISEMEIAIGKTHSDRVRTWLEQTIGGKPYTRIGKTIRLYSL